MIDVVEIAVIAVFIGFGFRVGWGIADLVACTVEQGLYRVQDWRWGK